MHAPLHTTPAPIPFSLTMILTYGCFRYTRHPCPHHDIHPPTLTPPMITPPLATPCRTLIHSTPHQMTPDHTYTLRPHKYPTHSISAQHNTFIQIFFYSADNHTQWSTICSPDDERKDA
jgi:hypothetical protein